jgi:hypothetical protein
MERGLIISSDVEVDVASKRISMRSSEPNAGLLRQAVLYWDRIDFPQNNLIHVESRDINFLKEEGIAQTTQIRVGGGEMAALYVQAQFAAFDELNRTSPGTWTLGQSAAAFFAAPSSRTVQERLAEIALNALLPVPPDDEPLAELLAFKSTRKDELRKLRAYVDELYQEIVNSACLPRAESAALLRVQSAIADIRAVAEASWLRRNCSIKFDYTLPKALAGALLTSSVAIPFPGLEYPLAAAGALISGISVSAEPRKTLANLPDGVKNFAYLYHLAKQYPGTLKN